MYEECVPRSEVAVGEGDVRGFSTEFFLIYCPYQFPICHQVHH